MIAMMKCWALVVVRFFRPPCVRCGKYDSRYISLSRENKYGRIVNFFLEPEIHGFYCEECELVVKAKVA